MSRPVVRPCPDTPQRSDRRLVLAPVAALAVAAAVAATFSFVVPITTASAAVAATAEDAFSRQAANTWGSSETGGVYTLTRATSTEIGTTGTAGYEKLSTGAEFTAKLKTAVATDVAMADSVNLSAAADAAYDVQHRLNVRQQADGSGYSGRIRITSDGQATLGLTRLNGSSSSWLSGVTLPITIEPGQSVRTELEVNGSSPVSIKMRGWIVGTAVPEWQVSHADTSASRVTAAGFVGMTDYAFMATSPVTVSHDDLYAGLPGTTPTPAPPTSSPSAEPTASPSAEPTTSPSASPTTSTSAEPTPTTSPSTSPSAPPTPGPATNRGSAVVGSASYPVPAGAVFVSPTGSDSNAGTELAPLRTVMAAVPKIPSNGARTIVLRGGVYHQSVKVESNRSATIQNYPGEEVWFDGSVPVNNWSESGSTWVATGWTAEFSSAMGSNAAFKNQFIGTNKLAADPDQLFLDGTALKQVGTAAEVVAGTFAVDDAADTLTIGSDPTDKQVRASDLAQAIFLSGKNSVVKGIGVRRYANPYEAKGAVRVINTGGTIENVVVEDVATFGVTVSSPGKTIDHVTVQRAGMIGVGGNQADDSTISNSIISNNNTEGFKSEPESGGLKFTASRTVKVDNIEANNNLGATGIWFDVSSHNLTIVNSTANGNTKYGIEVEISGHGIIANNQAIGGEVGIIVFDSNDFKVFNNDVGNNTLYGIKLAQDERRQASLGSYPYARDPRQASVVDPTVTWITENVQVSNNAFGKGNRNHSHLYSLDARTNRHVDTWNITVDGNLFNKVRFLSSEPTMMSWGKSDNVNVERYETSSALGVAKNSSWENAQLSTTKAIADMGQDKATHASVAVPIPSDVATATGLTAGAQLMGAQ